MSTEQNDAVIVGAGLSGLTCALKLQDQGFSPLLIDSAPKAGGRIRSEEFKGFRLDAGFQVLLTAYPEAAELLDYAALDLRPFVSGALIRHKGRFTRLADPFREPQALFSMLVSDIAPMHDKLRIAYLRQRVINMPMQEIFKQPDRTIEKALTDYGFTNQIIDRFFRPFFGGITLDRSLSGSSRFFEFIYKMMAEGQVAIPARGMGEITAQLSARLKRPPLLSTRVNHIDIENNSVHTDKGVFRGRAITVATDWVEASRLLPDLYSVCPRSRMATCFYFSAPKAPVSEAMLVLNGDEGLINNLAVMSNVSGELAPEGLHLISVTVLGENEATPADILKELTDWFGDECGQFEHLKTFKIPHAQPDQSPPWLEPPRRSVKLSQGSQVVYVCGDHRDNASINGAIASGKRTANLISQDLRVALGS